MIEISLNATSCPNKCRHCWVYGGDTHQREIILKDKLWEILDRFENYDSEVFSLGLGAEPTYYPYFIEFLERTNKTTKFENTCVIPTNGWGIARDPDVAFRMKEAGIKSLRFTIYGKEPSHDWFAQRKGAYNDIITAADRAKSVGIDVRWNILLHKGNLPQISDILVMIQNRGEKCFPTIMEPTGRGSEIHHLTLGVTDFDELPEGIKEKYSLSNLFDTKCGECLKFPCFVLDPITLDVHFRILFSGGFEKLPISKIGNLETDNIIDIANNIKKNQIYQLLTSISVQELAEMYEKPDDKQFSNCYLHRKWFRQYLCDNNISIDFLIQ